MESPPCEPRSEARLPVVRRAVLPFLLLATLASGQFQPGQVTLVSMAETGDLGWRYSDWPAISGNGRYVAFLSDAPNFIEGNDPNYADVYWKDLQTGELRLVSSSASGVPGNGQCDSFLAISQDGRLVAFTSAADNLVPGDTNGAWDVFVKDVWTGGIERVSTTGSGTQANNTSLWPALSDDGRWVAFNSRASNLVSGDTNGVSDIFLKDRLTGSIQRISVSSAGAQSNNGSLWPSMDATGRLVAFGSYASNLVSGDTNSAADVFLRDLSAGTTVRVSVAADGTQGNGESDRCALSANGRKLVFASSASNLIAGDTNSLHDIFVKDLPTGSIQRVSVSTAGTQSNGWSEYPAISADGQVIAFASRASNLVSEDTNGVYDVFIRRLSDGVTQRASVAQTGTQADGESSFPVLNADGRFVAFRSAATNLVVFDTNGVEDVFMKHLTGAGFGGDERVRSAWLEVLNPGRGTRSVRLNVDFRAKLTGTVELRVVSASSNLNPPASIKVKAGLQRIVVDLPVSAPLVSGESLFVEIERLGRTTRAEAKVR